MIIETYFDDGEILETKVDLVEEVDEKEVIGEVSEGFFKQISQGRYICIPEGDGHILINADRIRAIKMQPTEKENSNVTSED